LTKAFFSSIRLAASSIAYAVILAVASDIACGQFGANRISLPQNAKPASCGNITLPKAEYHCGDRRNITNPPRQQPYILSRQQFIIFFQIILDK